MKRVYFIPNPLDYTTYEEYDVSDLCAFLREKFDRFPHTGRIYHRHLAQTCDVTPLSDADIDRLQALEGPFYVVIYPGEPITIVLTVVAVLTVAAAFLMRPKVATPNPTLRNNNNQNTSPNNELSGRTNKARVNGRIPDIYGTVRSTPDLLMLPYKIFVGHTEVEYSYMCIGRGHYDISDIRDDTTPVSSIAGTSVEIFEPNTSPNNSGSPQLRIGAAITRPLYYTTRSNSVDGQLLRAPNANKVIGETDIRFVYPDEIQLKPGSEKDFTAFFEAGDEISVTDAEYGGSPVIANHDVYVSFDAGVGTIRFDSFDPTGFGAITTITMINALFPIYDGDSIVVDTVDLGGEYQIASITSDSITLVNPETTNPQWSQLGTHNDVTPYETEERLVSFYWGQVSNNLFDLTGDYEILAVDSHLLVLANPELVNADWTVLDTLTDDASEYLSPLLVTTGPKWIGPFFMNQTTTTKLIANFVALNGLYKDNGQNQIKTDISVRLEVTPVDANGDPTGAAVEFDATIEGSAQTRATRAVTLTADLPFTGRCIVRARRLTDTDLEFNGSVVDEVKWRDLYSAFIAPESHFGNVTTVHAVTIATSGALSIKDRKLNMIVTRKIPQRVSGSTFTETLHATNDAAEIISAICLDPYIGNRNVTEIDFDSIYETIDEVVSYFGIAKAGEFSYTLDSDNLSFEEIITMVATAVFCTAYRRGNVIKLSFERETDDSTLLFNHRNKLPGSETRTFRFGNQKDNDGIEYQYVDPSDDSLVTYYIPEDRSAVNPEKVESIGVRSYEQAYLHAWRLWNKIRFQNIGCEFIATQEADLIVNNDRILVADNTRPDTQDGEVIAQDGLVLTLSQAVELDDAEGHTMFLQHKDGTVQSVAVSAGPLPEQVAIADAPTVPLALSEGQYAMPTYVIVGNSETARATAFLATEKEVEGNLTFKVSAINYDSRYYANDKDFT